MLSKRHVDQGVRIDGRIGGYRFTVVFGGSGKPISGNGQRLEGEGSSRPVCRSDCGDRYRDELHDRLGGVPCGACEKERQRMNGLSVEQCVSERNQIIEATVKRATAHPKWSERIKAKLANRFAPLLLRDVVGECFDSAMIKAVNANRSEP